MAPDDEELHQLEEDEETEDLDNDEESEAREQWRAKSWWGRRRVEPEERDRVLGLLFNEKDRKKPYLYRFALLQSMSVIIAVIGVMADSPAIVIGAMLLAPLMMPVLAVAAALVMVWPRRVAKSITLLIAASVGSVLLAWLVALVMPDAQLAALPHEMISRTRPNLLDLVVALAAGTAGGYAIVREEVGSALPGVAVAVALVPPLAVVGAALDLGRTELALGAGLLYITNLSAIIFAGGIVFLVTGFIPTVRITRLSWQVGFAVMLALIPVAVIAYPLTQSLLSAVREAKTTSIVSEEVRIWIGDRRLVVNDVQVNGNEIRVELMGADGPPAAAELGVRLAERLDRQLGVVVHVIERREEVFYPNGG